MRYLGGKSKISKRVVESILESTTNRDRYIEPFVGGGAVLFEASKHFKESLACDIHPDLILMWQGLQNGSLKLPHDVSLEYYQSLRKSPPSAERGFVGFAASWGGKWFGGYARGAGRNWADESARGLERDILKVSKSTSFVNIDYRNINVRSKDVVYCDPPFADTTGYSNNFNSLEFWKVAEKWISIGASVFVSEYKAPFNWKEIWRLERTRDLKSKLSNPEKVIEILYTKGDTNEL